MIGEHDVVRARHAHDIGASGDAEQRQQCVHVVLVGVGMVGVADVDTHRQAEQLAAEMIFKPGASDLLAVEQIFRTDEADDGVDEQRLEVPRDGVGARLHRLLVDAVMRVGGQRRALAGLEIHDVVAESAALERQRRVSRFFEQPRGRCRSFCSRLRCRRSDWKTRSTGAPCSMARKVVVTCASTQDCVGIAQRRRISSIIRNRSETVATLSVAGLMPITASPLP